MYRILVVILLLLFCFGLYSQQVRLPEDFRQHTLTQYNASLLNANYASDWNKPRSLSLWTRWQWQTVDSDPTSLFLNYTHDINEKIIAGVGFLQHNTGTFLNTGGILNLVYTIPIQANVSVIVGTNVYLFDQEVADSRFNTDTDLSEFEGRNDFLGQFSPGFRFNVNQFSIGASLENILSYNFSQSSSNSDNLVFTGTLSNDFPITFFSFSQNSFVRPVLYIRSIPNFEAQIGGNVLLSTAKFWIQGGYNSFYGFSGGVGATFLKRFSIGGLVEFGVDDALRDEDATFEVIASYHFGKSKNNKSEFIESKTDEVNEELKNLETVDETNETDELESDKQALEEQKRNIEIERRKDEEIREQKAKEDALLEQEKIERLKAQQDSIQSLKRKKVELLKEKNRLDSIAKIQQTKEVKVLPNEKYEEVTSTTIEGLTPGFYLIANVFGTKKYFDAFMKSMTDKGLEPKSFYRKQNKYNYVYLRKYSTIEEARKARNSNLSGKYSGKTWIFRVKGK